MNTSKIEGNGKRSIHCDVEADFVVVLEAVDNLSDTLSKCNCDIVTGGGSISIDLSFYGTQKEVKKVKKQLRALAEA